MITETTDSEIVILSVHTVRDPERKRPILKTERHPTPPKPDIMLWDKGTFLVAKESICPGIFWAVCVGMKVRLEVVMNPVNYTFVARKKFAAVKKICRTGSKQSYRESRPKEPLAVAPMLEADGREAGASHRSLVRLAPAQAATGSAAEEQALMMFTD